jgi:hypothetical protein
MNFATLPTIAEARADLEGTWLALTTALDALDLTDTERDRLTDLAVALEAATRQLATAQVLAAATAIFESRVEHA